MRSPFNSLEKAKIKGRNNLFSEKEDEGLGQRKMSGTRRSKSFPDDKKINKI